MLGNGEHDPKARPAGRGRGLDGGRDSIGSEGGRKGR